ncbi:MAG: transporter substrate-binding domain-containing protein [Pseudomonadota bacterium]
MRGFVYAALAAVVLNGTVKAETPAFRVTTGEYPPFTGQALSEDGSVNSIVWELAETAGLAVSFQYLPWKRALEAARTGKYAASSFWYFSEEREEDFIHVGPILNDRLVFFHRTDLDLENWNEISDLAGYRIGAVTGYTYSAEFWQLGETGVLDIDVGPSDAANLRKLMAGRIDMFPMSEQVGYHLIDQLFTSEQAAQLTIQEQPLQVSEGYLLVSRAAEGAEQLAQSLQAAVDTIEPIAAAQSGSGIGNE